MTARLMLLLFFSQLLAAQTNPYLVKYRSKENTYYWKNRPPGKDYWQQDVHYKIKARLDDKTDVLYGDDYSLTYWNNSPDTLKELYFHLYENAFQPGSYYSNLWKNNRQKPKYGKYEAAGLGTAMDSLRVNGMEVRSLLDNTVLKIWLNNPLYPGDSLVVGCRFKTWFDNGSMRRRNKFFEGMGYKHYDAVHWYPIVCVYDRKFGWNTDQHLDKEFYTNFGSFDIEISLPNNYINEATGTLLNREEVLPDTLRRKLDLKNFKDKPLNSKPSVVVPREEGLFKTWKYYAVNVHNFAFTTDPLYRIDEQEWNGIKVIALVQETHASKWQPSAYFTQKVMEVYSRDFGAYIWPKIVVADAQDGMEYPMITLDGGLYPQHQSLLAHEVGHMWFYGMLGSNETYRAFLDEGFTQFLTSWSMEAIEGKKRARVAPDKYTRRFQDSIVTRFDQLYNPYIAQVQQGYDAPLNTHSSGYSGALRHGGGYSMVYYKTGVMLYNLRYVLGDSLFLKAMKHYVAKWKMAHPYPEDFRQAIIEYTKTDLNWFFDEWLETTKYIDYAIQKVKPTRDSMKSDDYRYDITFKRKGTMQMPIDFSVYTKSGKEYRYHIPNTWFVKETNAMVLPKWYGWDLLQPDYTAHISIPEKLADIVIDPDHYMADIDLTDNSLSGIDQLQFDHRVFNPPSWTKKKDYIRPDIWWNGYDGVQVGFSAYGDYFGQDHFFKSSFWYNTGVGQYNIPSASKSDYRNISFFLSGRHNLSRFSRQMYYWNDVGFNAGLFKTSAGLEKTFRAQDTRNTRFTKVFLYGMLMYREKSTDALYLLYPEQWGVTRVNSTINMGIQKSYPIRNGTGDITLEARTPGLLSDYNYYYIQMNALHHWQWKRLGLRTRLYARAGSGNTPLESALYLAGANPEQLYGNRLTRAAGIVPTDWLGYGTGTNHFQQGGGLNLRGYAGYIAPTQVNGNWYTNYSGNSGTSFSAELDLGKLAKVKTGKFTRNFRLDPYLFHDMGFITYTLNERDQRWSHLRTSSGVGTTLNISFGNLNIKPLVLRFDMPLVLNTPPPGQNYFQFRYVVGINRSF